MSFANPYTPPCPSKAGQVINWGHLKGSALAFSIKTLLEKQPQFIVAITPDPQSAFRLQRALRIYIGNAHPVLHFPDWETLPYDHFSPHQDLTSERLATLAQLPYMKTGVLVVPITTLYQRVVPPSFVQGFNLNFKVGDTLDSERLKKQLVDAGYRPVSQVVRHGEFSQRGAIVDLFPMGHDQPIRLDLFDDEIETLRYFDPDTQRSHEQITQIELLPAHEFPFDDASIKAFRTHWRTQFDGNPTESTLYTDVSNGISPPGIEYYLPLFFGALSHLFEHLPENTLVVRPQSLEASIKKLWTDLTERYEQRRHNLNRPILPPQALFLRENELFSVMKPYAQIKHSEDMLPEKASHYNLDFALPPHVAIDSQNKAPLAALQQHIEGFQGRVLLCAESKGRKETLLEVLARSNIVPTPCDNIDAFLKTSDPLQITVASLDEGIVLPQAACCIIAESELYGNRVMQRRRRRRDTQTETDNVIRDLTELKIGAAVVHLDHGIGKYIGLKVIEIGQNRNEYLTLQYANDDKLYVPVASLHLISQYAGAQSEHTLLNRLGSDQFEKAKAKAKAKAFDVAAELLDVYAQREAQKGYAFPAPDDHYHQFCNSFPFEETPDQLKAIDAVLADMQSPKPMDRLICGDVGFGKTEVALRAAFFAAMAGKQVALLTPTTLLAQQHGETFKDRFADWPITVEVISRFQSKKSISAIVEKLAAGQIDVLVGTHKVIQADIKFKDLGLLMIDEEHRFGVKQKEKLKAFRANVDILTLTATPIPRTLNMAFASIRDLSIIATPPAKRRSIKTFVNEYDFPIIEEAILREIMRGGQVYYVHNKVDSIHRVANDIQAAIPQARVSVAHGQMHERELESIMSEFYHQKTNVLVCTTIIETGIDIPSANTIIIERADKFGLAQLHQLRGRVGRSHHQAYAHCLTPSTKLLTADAKKRLEALSNLEDLGSGFTLATHDLEIRGAGELLGSEQSGHMTTIGFSLYMELLEKAVKTLKSGKTIEDMPALSSGAEIDLQVAALIPDDYIPDVHIRLTLYKRIANAKNVKQLDVLKVEMIDRFGLLPEEVKQLFALTVLKIHIAPLGIKKIEASHKAGHIQFTDNPNIDVSKIINLIKQSPQHYQLSGSSKLSFKFNMPSPQTRFQVVEKILNNLSDNVCYNHH